jgi:putative thioredoxin
MAAHAVDVGEANFREVVLEGSRHAPVIIDFWAPWCAPCRALKPILEKLAAEYDGKFTLAKINSDENPEIAAQFGVRGIPAVKAVVDGSLVDEFTGALPESQVRAFIERVIPSPSEVLRKQANALFDGNDAEGALALLEQAIALDARNEAALVDRLAVLVELQRYDEANAVLATLSPLSLDEPQVAALRAKLMFAADGAEDTEALSARIARDPGDLAARLDLARRNVRAEAFEPALAELLEIVRRDRKFGDDAGRRTMLEVFNLLGPADPLVSKYRRLLASALY